MTRRPARRLVEPDYWTCPHGHRGRPTKALTYGPQVADVCADAGFAPDPQQELGLDLIFAINPDGSPATFHFCVICCRQNLKTGLFKQAVVGWLFVTEQRLMVWSSHEMSTTIEAQRDLADLIEGAPALAKYLPNQKNHGVYYDNGSERIELATGQRCLFKARTLTGARGLAAPKLILDEKFAAKAAMMGSLLPLMLAQHHPQMLSGSSAGKADSEVLFDDRERGRSGVSPNMTYLEWLAEQEDCSDPDCEHPKDALARGIDCALDREHLIRKANPAIAAGRIDIGTVRNLRQELPPAEFMRECLGWWEDPDDLGPPAVDLRKWGDASKPTTPAPSRAAVVIDVEPDRSAATVGLAGNGPGDRVLMMVHHRPGTAWVTETVKTLQANTDVLEVALHPTSQAGQLLPQLAAAGIDVHKLTSTDLGQGWSGFQTGVVEGRFTHLGQVELDAAVSVARTRKLPTSEAQLVDRKAVHVPLGPVITVSVAQQRYATLTVKPTPQSPRKAPARRSPGRSVATAGF